MVNLLPVDSGSLGGCCKSLDDVAEGFLARFHRPSLGVLQFRLFASQSLRRPVLPNATKGQGIALGVNYRKCLEIGVIVRHVDHRSQTVEVDSSKHRTKTAGQDRLSDVGCPPPSAQELVWFHDQEREADNGPLRAVMCSLRTATR